MKKPKMPPKTNSTYSIRVECSNCDHQGTLNLPKGHAADEKHKCPNCGCETAVKTKTKPPVVPFMPTPIPWNPVDLPYVNPPWHPSHREPYTLETSPNTVIPTIGFQVVQTSLPAY